MRGIIMDTPLKSAKFPFDGRSIALAATILMTISHQASAKGGTFHLWSAFGRAEAATITTPSHGQRQQEPLTLGGCGGKRYRDPNTHQCRALPILVVEIGEHDHLTY
jgi:hypothetical protein